GDQTDWLIQGDIDEALEVEQCDVAVAARLNQKRLDIRAVNARSQNIVSRRPASALQLLDLGQTRRRQREVRVLKCHDLLRVDGLQIRALRVDGDPRSYLARVQLRSLTRRVSRALAGHHASALKD